jgi:hypothetical protein
MFGQGWKEAVLAVLVGFKSGEGSWDKPVLACRYPSMAFLCYFIIFYELHNYI